MLRKRRSKKRCPSAWIAERVVTEASVKLRRDGTARIATAAQDIGGGTYTVLSQIISETVGIPHDRIEVVLGDIKLPPGPLIVHIVRKKSGRSRELRRKTAKFHELSASFYR
jgi:CO/xanthine dehydrogenase Mo-binding subunit